MRQGAARLLRAPSSGSSTTLALGGAEVVAAFEVIRDELEVHERFKLRSVLKVPAPSGMAPESVAERVATEMKALSKAMAANAATKGRGGVNGRELDTELVHVAFLAPLRNRQKSPVDLPLLVVSAASDWSLGPFVTQARKPVNQAF